MAKLIVPALLLLSACATSNTAEVPAGECGFLVRNQTNYALEIRLVRGRQSSSPIGALNPGETLTYHVPCVARFVWVRGVAIPWQVGAPTFWPVDGAAELLPHERVAISLWRPG